MWSNHNRVTTSLSSRADTKPVMREFKSEFNDEGATTTLKLVIMILEGAILQEDLNVMKNQCVYVNYGLYFSPKILFFSTFRMFTGTDTIYGIEIVYYSTF